MSFILWCTFNVNWITIHLYIFIWKGVNSFPSRVKWRTVKLVFVASPLSTHQVCEVRVKSGWLGVWHNVSLYILVSGCKSLEVTAVSTHSHLACHVGHSLKIRINFQFMIRNNVFCYLTASEIGFNKRGFLIRGGLYCIIDDQPNTICLIFMFCIFQCQNQQKWSELKGMIYESK